MLILSPILLILSALIKIKLGSPILFKQQRPGLDQKPFIIFKFRTMTNKTDDEDNLLPNTERQTTLGRFLRKTSLDELPELYNVIKGDMSLVGPRPLKMSYLELYNSSQRRRHEVRPGITGLAQVKGRNAISFIERFKLDVFYVDNQSFWLDMKIIFLTFFKVIKKENIKHQPGTENKPWNGNN